LPGAEPFQYVAVVALTYYLAVVFLLRRVVSGLGS
jgi:hypothetical protein